MTLKIVGSYLMNYIWNEQNLLVDKKNCGDDKWYKEAIFQIKNKENFRDFFWIWSIVVMHQVMYCQSTI